MKGLLLLLCSCAFAQDIKILDKGKLLSYNNGDDFQTTITGRLHYDGANYANGDQNGTDLRDATITWKTKTGANWSTKFEAEFSKGETVTKEAWGAYKFAENWTATLGQMKEPFGMNQLTSGADRSFMESALPTVFQPKTHLGMSLKTKGDAWHLTAGAYGRSVDANSNESLSARFVALPWRHDEGFLHVGLAASYRNPTGDANGTLRYKVRPETFVNGTSLLNTGTIDQVENCRLLGLELAGAHRSFHYQGEWTSSKVMREGVGQDATFNGWYMETGYVLTGESRPYNAGTGVFKRLKPSKQRLPFALELTARYSTLNLTDTGAGYHGGDTKNATVGLSLYMGLNFRLIYNQVFVNPNSVAEGSTYLPGEDFSFHQMRLQVVF